MSPLTDAMIINGAVLIAVLEGDLGSHRKIGRVRILRPLLTVAAVIPLFLDRPVTHGHGLLVELAGIAVGLLCGLVVTMLMRVYRSPRTGRPVSAAGFPYAIVWTVIVAARAVFSIGATNWFPAQLAQWCAAHQVTGAAITDGLIFMAITMVLVRTMGLYTRAIRLPAAPAPARSGQSSFARLFAQWPEARADLFGKELRLFLHGRREADERRCCGGCGRTHHGCGSVGIGGDRPDCCCCCGGSRCQYSVAPRSGPAGQVRI